MCSSDLLAYFDMLNASGGVKGRKIKLISLDDGYNPAKTVKETRALVEKENVLGLFSSLGGATNGAIHKYVNDKKIPHLFIASNLMRWADPEHFPWTIQSIRAPFYLEGQVYARYMLRVRPKAKIAILYFNEDTAKDYLAGFKSVLGDNAYYVAHGISPFSMSLVGDCARCRLEAERAALSGAARSS